MPYGSGMNTIVETKVFTKKAAATWSESEKDEFIGFIARNPLAGNVIPGTGGVRKVRWSRQGIGHRSGVRIIYYNKTFTETWLLALYAKNEKIKLPVNAMVKMRDETYV